MGHSLSAHQVPKGALGLETWRGGGGQETCKDVLVDSQASSPPHVSLHNSSRVSPGCGSCRPTRSRPWSSLYFTPLHHHPPLPNEDQPLSVRPFDGNRQSEPPSPQFPQPLGHPKLAPRDPCGARAACVSGSREWGPAAAPHWPLSFDPLRSNNQPPSSCRFY